MLKRISSLQSGEKGKRKGIFNTFFLLTSSPATCEVINTKKKGAKSGGSSLYLPALLKGV